MSTKSNIQVSVRVRPSRNPKDHSCWDIDTKNKKITKLEDNANSFQFNYVYSDADKTETIYKDVAAGLIYDVLNGLNATIFAYGQTGSGKTYTMTGTLEQPGIIPLSIAEIFTFIENAQDRDVQVNLSYFEIYNENTIDLLNGEKVGIGKDASFIRVYNAQEALNLISEYSKLRATAATGQNDQSSRSHAILRLKMDIQAKDDSFAYCSQLDLVDLAGSENQGKTGATGERQREGSNINKSLLSLSKIINAIANGQKPSSYRESKLTIQLKNSLGGNAKTAIITTITTDSSEQSSTMSSLRFAKNAMCIKNDPKVNKVTTDKREIAELKARIRELEKQLEEAKNRIPKLPEERYKENETLLMTTMTQIIGFNKIGQIKEVPPKYDDNNDPPTMEIKDEAPKILKAFKNKKKRDDSSKDSSKFNESNITFSVPGGIPFQLDSSLVEDESDDEKPSKPLRLQLPKRRPRKQILDPKTPTENYDSMQSTANITSKLNNTLDQLHLKSLQVTQLEQDNQKLISKISELEDELSLKAKVPQEHQIKEQELKARIEGLINEKNKLQIELQKMSNECEKKMSEIEGLRIGISELNQTNLELKDELEQTIKENDDFEEYCNSLRDENMKLGMVKQANVVLKKQIQEVQDRYLSEIAEIKESQRDEIDRLNRTINERDAELDRLHRLLTSDQITSGGRSNATGLSLKERLERMRKKNLKISGSEEVFNIKPTRVKVSGSVALEIEEQELDNEEVKEEVVFMIDPNAIHHLYCSTFFNYFLKVVAIISQLLLIYFEFLK